MKIKVYNKPFGKDGLPRVWFGKCICLYKSKRTELNIHLFKKLIWIDLGACKDCGKPLKH
jgi:hypothetical protein